jgi:hypothetical protein
MEIKDLAKLLGGKAGRNSLLLKNFPCEFFLVPRKFPLVYGPEHEYYLAAMPCSGYATNRYSATT